MNERITKAEAISRGYRQNDNGEWLRPRSPADIPDGKYYFIGEEVMTDIEAVLVDALRKAHFRLFGAGPSTDELYAIIRDALYQATGGK